MFGYVYITTNKINNKVYIGKKESEVYDSSYFGSGKILHQAIKKYGIENFTNEIIDTADSLEELNQKEIFYITHYKKILEDMCYNIAGGGTGGNVHRYSSEKDMKNFKEKMKKINKERCNTEKFKSRISEATSNRYKDQKELERHTSLMRKIWEDEDLRKAQSERSKKNWEDEEYKKKVRDGVAKYWENNTKAREDLAQKIKEVWDEDKKFKHSITLKEAFKDEEYKRKKSEETTNRWRDEEYKERVRKSMSESALSRPNKGAEARRVKLLFIFEDEEIIFNSRKEFEDYCLKRFNSILSARNYNELIKTEKPYRAYYKKHKHMNGIILKQLTKSVETMADECKPVE